MKTITVNASRHYNIFVGSGLLHMLSDYIKQIKQPCKAVIISDTNVWPLYGETAASSLIAAGFDVSSYVFTAGESSKNVETYISILNYLAEKNITRSDCLVALGGGVVGDITGFVAATFLRGIDYIQVPTSLLAMVDSSVGGKTAIDLPGGKNLAGAFWQPRIVLCDIKVLSSLPRDVFLDGCAEVIKYGVLFDEKLFNDLEENGPDFSLEETIAKCITWKRDVVIQDEFDTGERQKLNLGHTVGHAVEKISDYTISHGRAVAAGMSIISRASSQYGYCAYADCQRICSILEQFELPCSTDYSVKQLISIMLSDKKRFGETVSLIVPRSIGNCDICPFPISELDSFIKAGLL